MSNSYPPPDPSQQPVRRPVNLTPGFLRDAINEVRLVWRLFRDPRISMGLKLIPPTALIYTLSPVDLIPDVFLGLGQLDDLAVLLLGVRMFVEMCPPEIVHEHRAALAAEYGAPPPPAGPNVVDTSWRVVDPLDPDDPANQP